MAGGGGGGTSSSTSSSTTTSTQQTATGTVGSVNQIASGTTINTSDYGAIDAAAKAGQASIDAISKNSAAIITSGANEASQLFNFVGATEQGAADIVSKALALAAATSGNASAVNTLASPPPAPSTVTGQLDLNSATPWLVGGVVLYMFFKKG